MKNLKNKLQLERVLKHEKEDYRNRGCDILESENWWSNVADRSFKNLADAKNYLISA